MKLMHQENAAIKEAFGLWENWFNKYANANIKADDLSNLQVFNISGNNSTCR